MKQKECPLCNGSGKHTAELPAREFGGGGKAEVFWRGEKIADHVTVTKDVPAKCQVCDGAGVVPDDAAP